MVFATLNQADVMIRELRVIARDSAPVMPEAWDSKQVRTSAIEKKEGFLIGEGES